MTDMTSFDGTRLALSVRGPVGAPVVILVHGLGLSMEAWGIVPDLLAQDYRVIAYDLRGHGRSENALHGDYSLKAHANDLQVILSSPLCGGSQATVVGNSLGGGIIVAHAHHFGAGQVAGAVFAGSGGSGVTFAGFPANNLPAPVRRALRLLWLCVLRAGTSAGNRIRVLKPLGDKLIRRYAFAPGDPQGAVARVREDFLGSRPRALAHTMLASVSHDGTRMAPDLTVPTLVLHGSEDPEVTDDELSTLMRSLPQGELVNYPGEGHMLPLTRPDVVAEETSRWVRHVLNISETAL